MVFCPHRAGLRVIIVFQPLRVIPNRPTSARVRQLAPPPCADPSAGYSVMCSSTVAELLEGERHFQALADFVPHLMWIGDGWIYWYNKRWYDYTGTAAGQMKGWGWQAVHDPGVLPEVVEQWKRSIATGEPFEMVFPLRGADGAFRPFLTRALPLKTESGAVLRWFGTNTDVSEQKRAEERLRLLVNELNHRVKNTLASVQALASRSLKKSPDDGSKPFHDRLAALARAHDMLVQSK